MVLSPLGHSWILDLDGTIVKHNGYTLDGSDTLLPNALAFLSSIPEGDMIVFLTSRKKDEAESTEAFLKRNGIRFDHIIYEAPYGERILLNDDKPTGLSMAYAVRKKRDDNEFPSIEIDPSL